MIPQSPSHPARAGRLCGRALLPILAAISMFLAGSSLSAQLRWVYAEYFPFVWSPDDGQWHFFFTGNGTSLWSIDLGSGEATEQLPPDGFAPDSIAGIRAIPRLDENNSTFEFTQTTVVERGTEDGVPYTNTGTYDYVKSGPNSAMVVMYLPLWTEILVVKLTYTSPTTAEAIVREVDDGQIATVEVTIDFESMR